MACVCEIWLLQLGNIMTTRDAESQSSLNGKFKEHLRKICCGLPVIRETSLRKFLAVQMWAVAGALQRYYKCLRYMIQREMKVLNKHFFIIRSWHVWWIRCTRHLAVFVQAGVLTAVWTKAWDKALPFLSKEVSLWDNGIEWTNLNLFQSAWLCWEWVQQLCNFWKTLPWPFWGVYQNMFIEMVMNVFKVSLE